MPRDALRLLLGLLGKQDGLDVGQDTSLRDGNAGQQLVELLVVANGQLQVSRDDPSFLVVPGRVSCQLEHFGSQVLEYGRQVDGGAGTNSLCIVALSQQSVDPSHGKLEPRAAGTGLALALCLAPFSAPRHLGGGEKWTTERTNEH